MPQRHHSTFGAGASAWDTALNMDRFKAFNGATNSCIFLRVKVKQRMNTSVSIILHMHSSIVSQIYDRH